MKEIICPSCKKAFEIDQAGFSDIVKQVRDDQFDKELKILVGQAEKEKENAVKLAEADLRKITQDEIAKKDREIIVLQAKSQNAETEKKLSVSEAIKSIEKERDDLANNVKIAALEKQNLENSLRQQFSTELKSRDAIIQYKDDEIARVKDMKLKLSTKMLGESLEQYCEIEFNKIRSTAFQNAYFEKDNDSSSGSKGDFIFRENDIEGNEIISKIEKYKKVDFKKRYDDLKKHYDRKLGDWKSKEQSLKAEMLAGRTTYVAPKTPEELATFKEDYPDVFDVVETVAHMRAEEQLASLQEQVSQLSEKESVSNRRAAEQELLNVHPDFKAIRDSEDFHDWARVQPEAIQDWIYKNTGDASLAGRAIELYKLDAGISNKPTEAKSKTKSPIVDSRGSAADAVSVKAKTQDPTPQEKTWTTSEIANLSIDQYEKFQPQIDEAFKEGRIVNG